MDHTVTSIRIPVETLNRLRHLSQDRKRSVNFIILEWINNGLKEHE